MSDTSNDILYIIKDLKDVVVTLKNDMDEMKKEKEKRDKLDLINKCIDFKLPFKMNAYVPPPDENVISCSSKGKEKLIE